QRVGAVQDDAVVAGVDGDRDRAGRGGGQRDRVEVRLPGDGVAFEHGRALVEGEAERVGLGRQGVELRDHDGRLVVVVYGDFDVADDGVVEGRVAAEDRVAGDDDAVALRPAVVHRVHVDRLRVGLVPVRRVEHENHG